MGESINNEPQLKVDNQSFKEEQNASNINDLVIVGNDLSVEKKFNRRHAAVRINENNDIECMPGYRFNPFDHELLVHYLWKKVRKQPLPHNKITEIELYKYNPEDITQVEQGLVDKEWYFFTPRDRKYKNGSRPNRAAGNGYWKATGADKDVTYKGVIVGHRKALVFYHGKAPKGDKTNWIMHEFRVKEDLQKEHQRIRTSDNDMRLDDWVLCRIYKKDDRTRRAPKQSHADNSYDNSLDDNSPSNQNQNAAATTRNDINETGVDFGYGMGANSPPLMPGNPHLMGGHALTNIADFHPTVAMNMNNNTHYNHYAETDMGNAYIPNPQPLRYAPQPPFNPFPLDILPFEDWSNPAHYPLVDNAFLNDPQNDAVLMQSNARNVLPSSSQNALMIPISNSRNTLMIPESNSMNALMIPESNSRKALIVSESNSEIITPSNDNSPA